MDNDTTKLCRSALSIFMLSLCIVAGFRVGISIIFLSNGLDKNIKAIDSVIEKKNTMLSQCLKGTLSQKEARSILDEDDSGKILNEMKAFQDNITKPIQTNNKHMEVNYAPNMLRMIKALKPKAALIKEEDISKIILDDYPYMNYQLPNVLLDYPVARAKYNIFILLRQGDSIKLALFENKEIEYEMRILDTFPLNKILDGEGRVQAALYFVPPPTNANTNRTIDTVATGCDVLQYAKTDCDIGVDEIKLRFADGTTYYYDRYEPSNRRSTTPHKQY